jgi:hypothetical protein
MNKQRLAIAVGFVAALVDTGKTLKLSGQPASMRARAR